MGCGYGPKFEIPIHSLKIVPTFHSDPDPTTNSTCLSPLYIKFTLHSSTVCFLFYVPQHFFFKLLFVCVCSFSLPFNRLCYRSVTKTTMMTHRWSASIPHDDITCTQMSKSYQSNTNWWHDLLIFVCSMHLWTGKKAAWLDRTSVSK
jgi:hypothetical protein